MLRSARFNPRATGARLTSACALCLSCGLPADEQGAEHNAVEQSDLVPGDATPISLKKNVAALTRATSCDDVLARIQADTIARLVARAEELRHPPEVYAGEPGVVLGGDELLPPPPTAPTAPTAAGGVALPDSAPVPVPADSVNPNGSAAVDAPVSEPAPGPAGEGFSDTTVQVHEVDEADVIEADGDYLYVLQGSSLVKVQAWPADQTRTVAAVSIEGSPYEMFVSDGKALVFSTVSRDFSAPPAPYGGPYGYYYPSYTKVTVLDVEAETPVVLRESFLEGYYVASRRHDDIVRAVIQASYKLSLIHI